MKQETVSMRWSLQAGAMFRVAVLRVLSVGVVTAAAVAWGQVPGTLVSPSGKTLSGTIVGTSPNDVELEDQQGDVKRVPIDRVREVQFSDEPPALRTARSLLAEGRPSQAIDELGKVEAAELDGAPPLVVAEMDFVKAAAAGLLAVQSGDAVAEADSQVAAYLSRHPRSHHVYGMQQLLGDLRAKAGRLDEAAAAYSVIGKGPASFKVQAASGKAMLFFEQGKFAEAAREYDAALAVEATDDASLVRKRLASLGKARSLAGLGRQAEAVDLVNSVIKQADPEDKDFMARAYLALGVIYGSMPKKQQDALISLVAVDLLYNSVPDCHAEALYHLVSLWEQARLPERAQEAKQTLQATYPQTQWAKKMASAAERS